MAAMEVGGAAAVLGGLDDFETGDPDFCPHCGTLLITDGAIHGDTASVECPRCRAPVPVVVFEGVPITSTSREFAFQRPKFDTRVKEASASEGTKTDEMCPACGKREMTFTTAQLRSADEGQTIFFSCQGCGNKYNLNS
eukprot:m.33221 g.33221  ORF g.33221 m.33221 type:complete len:139 (+) comp12512_c0_seq2:116-532(+)